MCISTYHREVSDRRQRSQGPVTYGSFLQVDRRLILAEEMLHDVWLRKRLIRFLNRLSTMKRETHDVSSRITLTSEVQGASGQAGEDSDQIFEEAELHGAASHSLRLPSSITKRTKSSAT